MYKFLLIFCGCLPSFKAITIEQMHANIDRQIQLASTSEKDQEALKKLTREKIEKYYNALLSSQLEVGLCLSRESLPLEEIEQKNTSKNMDFEKFKNIAWLERRLLMCPNLDLQKPENQFPWSFSISLCRKNTSFILFLFLDTKKTKVDRLIGECLEILQGGARESVLTDPPILAKLKEKVIEIAEESRQVCASFNEKEETTRDPSFTESEWKILEKKSYDLTRLLVQHVHNDFYDGICRMHLEAFLGDR